MRGKTQSEKRKLKTFPHAASLKEQRQRDPASGGKNVLNFTLWFYALSFKF
jgi:hypothetical protein